MTESLFYSTEEMAKLLKRHPQTLRKEWRKRGSAYGITPIKLGARICWPKHQVAKIMTSVGAA